MARMTQNMHAGFGVENSGISKREDTGVFWNVILLKWVLKKENGWLWERMIWLRIGQVHYPIHNSQPLDPIK